MSGKTGSALTSRCPKAGWVTLTHYDGRRLEMPTTCKTWRCVSCRDKVKSLFKLRVRTGCSSLGTSMLTTFTYKVDYEKGPIVQYVKKDWREFWRRWSRENKRPPWLRVTEMTKKGMPHHHVVMGQQEGQRVRCYGRDFDVRAFERKFDSCDCASHSMARVWYAITGDSYIVHTMPVGGPKGAANYLSKYMMKTFTRSPDVGKRRWSCSRDWPGTGRLRLTNTVRKNWAVVHYRLTDEVIPESDPGLDERSGPAWAIEWFEKSKRAQAINEMRMLINGNKTNS